MDLLSKNIHWALRLCVASTFILHGFPKLGNSVANLGYIGYLVGPFEVLGGILLVAGPYINQVLTKIGAAKLNEMLDLGLTEETYIRTKGYKNRLDNKKKQRPRLDPDDLKRNVNDVSFNWSQTDFKFEDQPNA